MTSTNDELSAHTALEFVGKERKRGGALRLLATAFLIPMSAVMWLFPLPTGALLGIASAALLVRNLWQGLRSGESAMALGDAERMKPPVRARLSAGRLVLSNAEGIVSIPVSPREERAIRQLALPAARVVVPKDET